MKTMILTIVFSIMTMTLLSQVGLHSSIESGYENRQITVEGNGIYTMNNSLYSTLNFSASLKGLALYSSTKTFFNLFGAFTAVPNRLNSISGLLTTSRSFSLEWNTSAVIQLTTTHSMTAMTGSLLNIQSSNK